MNINCKGQLLDLTTPKVMGILNLTPDSFYDGGKYSTPKTVIEQTEKMLKEGATFIDVGAYSSRPDAQHITEEEELSRIVPIIELLVKEFPEILLSIDTFRSKVAQETVNAGAAIINDISGGSLDKQMFETAAKLQVPYILMHMKGTPQTMKKENNYEHMLQEIIFYFSEKVAQLRELKVNDIIIDPGFGFAKDTTQNFELMNHLSELNALELPMLVGISRKSMIYKTLDLQPQEALNGTTFLNTVSLLAGTKILRVHDVKEAVECVKLYEQLKN
ncbi:dihydropteroate synthase [Mesonia sp.]|uniref:dihydropteroate synthase n=1 Tax=Mesonia sp. TaxID=1960830 RepID=UPI001753FF3B|nr:dihydropteroate synthase [Mesonia sp.]HIB36399.1 dihydropteroate synthase [Mesonia sp.]HIO28068.1 dihydropteroate synthase [Flavobacteriaceae bacterium]